jgi:hypothetical protein
MRAYLTNSMIELALEDAGFRQGLMLEGVFILPLAGPPMSSAISGRELLSSLAIGEITIIDGKKYRVIKIHDKAIAFRRVYWYDWLLQKIAGPPPVEW